MTARLLALASRVEGLTEASREVDALIWCAVCPLDAKETIDDWVAAKPKPAHTESIGFTLPQWIERWPNEIEAIANSYRVPAYTASLDAVMSLVPEGWGHGYSTTDDRTRTAKAACWTEGNRCVRCDEAATPALALCAAALRAQAGEG